jgi:hypothetical protein
MHRITKTVLAAAAAWAAWRIHAGAGSLGPLGLPAEPWAAPAAVIAAGIVLSCVLFAAVAAAAGGGWRPRT